MSVNSCGAVIVEDTGAAAPFVIEISNVIISIIWQSRSQCLPHSVDTFEWVEPHWKLCCNFCCCRCSFLIKQACVKIKIVCRTIANVIQYNYDLLFFDWHAIGPIILICIYICWAFCREYTRYRALNIGLTNETKKNVRNEKMGFLKIQYSPQV